MYFMAWPIATSSGITPYLVWSKSQIGVQREQVGSTGAVVGTRNQNTHVVSAPQPRQFYMDYAYGWTAYHTNDLGFRLVRSE